MTAKKIAAVNYAIAGMTTFMIQITAGQKEELINTPCKY